MKSIIVKMVPGVTEILASITGIGQGEELPQGSGYTFHRWIDDDLAEYSICTAEDAYDAAIDEMIAKGLTITFPPEPETVEEVPIA